MLAALDNYYRTTNANAHRGAYALAVRATEAYEGARERLSRFVHAWAPDGVVFTRGTTEAINLVAAAWGRANVRPGDSIVVTAMDHHSNLVPWQILCAERGRRCAWSRSRPDGRLDEDDFRRALEARPRLVAMPYVSNVLGTINPVARLTRLAHDAGALVLVDGAQATPHAARRRGAARLRLLPPSRATKCSGRWGRERSSRSPRSSTPCHRITAVVK